MSPNVIRSALVHRISEGCPNMKAADYLIGVEGSGLPKTLPGNGGAFEIRWGARQPLSGRQRTLQRMRRVFAVRMLHASVASRGQEQHDQAELDEVAVRRALLDIDKYADGPLENVAGSIVYLGSDSPETMSGGSAYLQASNYHIDYTEDLGVVEE